MTEREAIAELARILAELPAHSRETRDRLARIIDEMARPIAPPSTEGP